MNTQLYTGIDRIDHRIGYVKENCVPCCKHCNQAKLEMGISEFYEWIDRVFENKTNAINALIFLGKKV